MGFRASWQKLRKEGWSSSRPTGLSSDFAYIKPGKTKKDTRGVDYFVGEQELMRYLDRINLSGKCSLVCLQRFVLSNLLCEWLPAVERQRSAHAQAKSALPSAPSTAPAAPTQPAASAGQDPLAHQVPAPAAPTQSTVQASVAPAQPADQAPPALRIPHRPSKTPHHVIVPLASRNPVDEGPDLDEEGPPPPEPLFDGALLTAVSGVGSIASGVIDAKVLKAMSTDGWSAPVTHEPYDYLQQPYVTRDDGDLQREYPGLYSGAYGPTSRALNAAVTASGAFFYFVQPRLWEDIAEASNHYFQEKLDERAQGKYEKQVARERMRPGYKKKTVEVIRNELQTLPDITAREPCVFVGLLIALAIALNKEKLENHWKTTDEGGIPRGCFGKFMTRDCFMHLSRNLHFSSNDAPEASTDRAGKLRPIIDPLQARFKSGYVAPSVMAFDEAMLPSRSSFNRMRVYMKDKSHKWGTKLFMLCCSMSTYCIR
ncbi:unnamed protein product [Phytophthora fragariaefolia]|uniref:Unnamed protein product n=1 Tax=Phytophthora fragariaefolia TaxID=1490495 RepID=A0A9W6TK52_9STRA|nr:unnamed protein product [Phytophthora fragariaefolia]